MPNKRPQSVSEVSKLVPPFLRSLPRRFIDSARDGHGEALKVAGFRFRGRLRNVSTSITTPLGTLMAAANEGPASFELAPEPRSFALRFSAGGRFRYETGGTIVCDAPDLLLADSARIRVEARNPSVLLVTLRQDAVARALGSESTPSVGMKALDKKHGSHLRALAFAAANEFERTAEEIRPALLRNFQNMFACALGSVLMQFAPGYRRPEPMIGRRKVADLREWAVLDHGNPVTVGDLAARCGLGVRALQKNFLRQFDTTPAAFLRNLRLEKARALIAAGALSVTHAAFDAGFVHLGHFSAAYERKYRELPSATLARHRAS